MKRLLSLCVIALLVPCCAWAMRYHVLPIEGDARLSGALTEQLVQLLKLSEENEVELAEMTLAEAIESFACTEETNSCMSQVGEMLDTDQLVWGKLVKSNGEWMLNVRHLDVSVAILLHDQEFKVPAKSNDSAQQQLSQALETFVKTKILELKEEEQAELLTLQVNSKPEGAEVYIDNQKAGKTPLEVKQKPGTHEVELRMAGYDTIHRRVKLTDSTLQLNLSMDGSAPVSGSKEGSGKPASFWLGVGTGVLAAAAIGTGIYAGIKTVDYKDKADKEEDYNRFVELRDDFDSMKTLSTVMWSVAGVATVSSVYFFFFHDRLFSDSTAFVPTYNGFSFYTQF